MNTILLWVLVSMGSEHGYGRQTVVIERFISKEDCVVVAEALNRNAKIHQCISMKVYKP